MLVSSRSAAGMRSLGLDRRVAVGPQSRPRRDLAHALRPDGPARRMEGARPQRLSLLGLRLPLLRTSGRRAPRARHVLGGLLRGLRRGGLGTRLPARPRSDRRRSAARRRLRRGPRRALRRRPQRRRLCAGSPLRSPHGRRGHGPRGAGRDPALPRRPRPPDRPREGPVARAARRDGRSGVGAARALRRHVGARPERGPDLRAARGVDARRSARKRSWPSARRTAVRRPPSTRWPTWRTIPISRPAMRSSTLEHPALGRVRTLGAPIRLPDCPGGPRTPAPLLGERGAGGIPGAPRVRRRGARAAARRRGPPGAIDRGDGDRALPLAGLRVANFGWGLVGPTAGQLLAFLGAEVYQDRVALAPRHPADDPALPARRPRSGPQHPESRLLGRQSQREPQPQDRGGQGRSRATLVARSDVVIENFGHGVMERFGLGYATLLRGRTRA